jgi:hypothetical protein
MRGRPGERQEQVQESPFSFVDRGVGDLLRIQWGSLFRLDSCLEGALDVVELTDERAKTSSGTGEVAVKSRGEVRVSGWASRSDSLPSDSDRMQRTPLSGERSHGETTSGQVSA